MSSISTSELVSSTTSTPYWSWVWWQILVVVIIGILIVLVIVSLLVFLTYASPGRAEFLLRVFLA